MSGLSLSGFGLRDKPAQHFKCWLLYSLKRRIKCECAVSSASPHGIFSQTFAVHQQGIYNIKLIARPMNTPLFAKKTLQIAIWCGLQGNCPDFLFTSSV
jgi:hypothetical protein